MSRIVKLEAENVKRLKAVCIDFSGRPVMVIGGKNGAGKSSTLDCIEYALGGKPSVAQPIRQGEDKARVVVETEDYVISRVFTAGGSRLEVLGKAGELRHAIKSPQALLDRLVGDKLAFDPLAFSRMDAKAQVETLKALVGVDFSTLDEERRSAYDERTAINRELKALRAQADGMPHHPDAPAKEMSVAELTEELERRMAANRTIEDWKNDVVECETRVKRSESAIVNLREQIAELEEKLSGEMDRLAALTDDLIQARETLSGCLPEQDVNEVKEQMRGAEAINAKVRENHKRLSILSQVERKEAEAGRYTERLDRIGQEKTAALAQANFPVDGLAFDENGVTFGGIPFNQCSSAEQLRVSVAMGLSMHRDLKLLLIRDGSLLDADSLRMVGEMAEAAGATIMIERVGEGEEVSVVIEDGLVKEVRAEKEGAK